MPPRCHAEIVTLSATTPDIGEMCSSQHSKDTHDHSVFFENSLQYQIFGQTRSAIKSSNSNFLQLFKLHAEDDPRLLDWLHVKLISIHLERYKIDYLKLWPSKSLPK